METSDVHPSQVQQDNRLKWQSIILGRSFRLSLLGGLLVLICLVLGFRILTTASIKGVVNAPILLVQSPIDGTVTMVGLKAGQTINRGEVIFQIENDRLNLSNVGRVRSEFEQAQAASDGLQTLVQDYIRKVSDLDVRLKNHLDANRDNITQKLREATEQRAKAGEMEAQSLRDFQRQKDLAGKGVDSKQA